FAFTGYKATDPFLYFAVPYFVHENDQTAAMFLLIRAKLLNTRVFVCPSSTQKEDDRAGTSPTEHCNFSDTQPMGWNLSYSFANLYPGNGSFGPKESEYKLTSAARSDFPLAADRNDPDDRFKNLNWNAPPSDMRWMNSQNHNKAGQNVLYND